MCELLSEVVRTVLYHVLHSYIGEESACVQEVQEM